MWNMQKLILGFSLGNHASTNTHLDILPNIHPTCILRCSLRNSPTMTFENLPRNCHQCPLSRNTLSLLLRLERLPSRMGNLVGWENPWERPCWESLLIVYKITVSKGDYFCPHLTAWSVDISTEKKLQWVTNCHSMLDVGGTKCFNGCKIIRNHLSWQNETN